ncbi:thioredoxin family protein [Maribacter sp. HTCC2170]|uniref:thioredoxin family protein n=1 Tax=Maribacter sp. (strain HTCC2170 / KCCM 42371) TaxID=313603 RepID=UPI00006BD278|nr:thioredoxin family protein [Maribacter sp. HTCC2170]EAR02702.1 hypothetical protein FB2170_05425 [Maribacter sp. HTCC2170]
MTFNADGTFLWVIMPFDPRFEEMTTFIMKTRTILIIGVLFGLGTLNTWAQEINQKSTDTNGREKLLGVINEEGLKQNSFAQWYKTNYDNYVVDSEVLTIIEKRLKKYEILAFMGTWCGDSRREIPRFYKILDSIDFPMENLTMVGVDNARENYKNSPTGEERGHDIIKVPTFIILKDGKEVNRIVETPKVSLEKDLKAIVQNASYIPNYKIVPVD